MTHPQDNVPTSEEYDFDLFPDVPRDAECSLKSEGHKGETDCESARLERETRSGFFRAEALGLK